MNKTVLPKLSKTLVPGIMSVYSFFACKATQAPTRSLPNAASNQEINTGSSTPNCLTATNLTTPTSWQNGIGTIFTNNCGSCHPGVQTSNYTTYASVAANIVNIITKIQTGEMPKTGSLAQADNDAIIQWATIGYPETDAGSPTPLPTADCYTTSTPSVSPTITAAPTVAP